MLLIAVCAFSVPVWFDPAIYYHSFSAPRQHDTVHFISAQQRNVTHEEFEHRMQARVYGEYSQEAANELWETYDYLDEHAPALTSVAKSITIIPERFDTRYAGQAHGQRMILRYDAQSGTIIHELAHLHSFALDNGFWDEWISISADDYRHKIPVMLYLDLHPTNDPEYPKDGFVSSYGAGNAAEDIATFVRAAHDHPHTFSKVPIHDVHKYQRKLHLLKIYGFISDDIHQQALMHLPN